MFLPQRQGDIAGLTASHDLFTQVAQVLNWMEGNRQLQRVFERMLLIKTNVLYWQFVAGGVHKMARESRQHIFCFLC